MSLIWSGKFDIGIFTFCTRGGRVSYWLTFMIKKGIAEDDNLLLAARNHVQLEAPQIQSRLEISNIIASIQCHTNFSIRITRTLTINFLLEGTNPNFFITKKERSTVDEISTIILWDIIS